MKNSSIPVFDLRITQKQKKYVNNCLNTNSIGQGSFVNTFEKKFSKYIGCKYGVTTTSGTTALHLACASIGLKKKDEVLVSSSTNMASAFSVDYCNAIPIPVDVEKDTWQMDVSKIEKKITKNTKAIMVVHLFGNVVDMDKVIYIANKHKIKIIEDCAEAVGVEYKGKKVGTFGDVSAFSFYVNKTITCGEGGMLLTNNKKIAEKAKSLKNLAYGKTKKFFHNDIGFNYRMSNTNAAIGLANLEDLEKILLEKKRIYLRYKKNLKKINGIILPTISNFNTNYVMWVFNILLDESFPISRDLLITKLKDKNIETRESFVPINQQKIFINKYKRFKRTDCPNANIIMKKGIYLPSGNTLTNAQIDYICGQIKKVSLKK